MTSPAFFLLSLGFAAHVLGDFVVQTEAVVRGKQNSNRVLLRHVGEHVLAMILLLSASKLVLESAAPAAALSVGDIAGFIGIVAVTHGIIDKLKILLDRHRGSSAASYVVDQILHVAVLAVATLWVAGRHGDWAELAPTLNVAGRSLGLTALATGILVVASYVFAMRAGAIFVWMITRPLTRDRAPEDLEAQGIAPYPLRDLKTLMGGYAERFLGLSCILLGSVPGLIAVYVGRSLLAARETVRRSDAPLLSQYRTLEILGGLSTVIVVGMALRFLVS